MAHFAKIDLNNIVTEVLVLDNREITDSNGVEQESIGVEFFKNLTGHVDWIQTSYNGNIRKNYAGIGYTFDEQRNAFIPPQPYPSWTLVEETCQWTAPVAMPTDGKLYNWNEETLSWIEVQT